MATRQESDGPPWGCRRGGGVRQEESRVPSLGLETPTPRREREALPGGSGAHWVLVGTGDEAPSGSLIWPPQAGAAGYLGAQGPGSPIAAPRLQQPCPGASQPDRGPPARTSSVGSPWPPAAPRPCPPPEPSGTGRPGSRLLRRTRPAQLCAQACVSGTETTRDPDEADRACHPAGRGLGDGCRGCREMGAEPAILGLLPGDVIPRRDLGDGCWLHSGVTHSRANQPPGPRSLCPFPITGSVIDGYSRRKKSPISRTHLLIWVILWV